MQWVSFQKKSPAHITGQRGSVYERASKRERDWERERHEQWARRSGRDSAAKVWSVKLSGQMQTAEGDMEQYVQPASELQ